MGEALIAVLDESCHHPSDEVTLDKEERDAWLGFWGFIAKETQRGRKRNNYVQPGKPEGFGGRQATCERGMSAA